MLVLSRKKNESIVIDDKISIVIIEIRGDKVRLGIDAPKDVTVHRQEVFEAIQHADADQAADTNEPAGKVSSKDKDRHNHNTEEKDVVHN
ncbi:MAG: carbon storage regulator CsrA [Thermoguttaceae bacterium]|nr:carbon storage regulator CsrA [Thermoguttaceae bacterium]